MSAYKFSSAVPSCRAGGAIGGASSHTAVRHPGGAGTIAAGLLAGVPTLILWMFPDQPLWVAQLKRLKVGSGRRFSTTTEKSLVAELAGSSPRNMSPGPARSPPRSQTGVHGSRLDFCGTRCDTGFES
jgi:hypothetical protein